jgi:N-acetyl-1-D-myo-inositol-2-amino-2-deoxy-alpha-D-glucopyranoside deacetylase
LASLFGHFAKVVFMAKATFNPKRLLVVHAHPDDESLFTGHILANAVASGSEVMVLTLTRGERGRMKLEELRSLDGNLPSMGAFRAGELRNALAALGVKHFKFAGTRAYLDSGFRLNAFGKPTKVKNLDELSLSAVNVAVIADDIYATIKDFRPDAVVTYNRKGGFGHPDHKMAHEGAAMALRRIAKENGRKAPEFWTIAEKGERADVLIGNAKTAMVKKEALSAHASQVSVGAETYSIAAGKEVRYEEQEGLRRASIRPLRWLKPALIAIWSLPLGVMVGLVGTMIHGIRASNAGHWPFGLWIALAMTFALALSLRLLRNSRGALYLMTMSLWGTLLWLSQRHGGGSVAIVGNEVGTWWVYGSLIACALVILFPRIRPGVWRKNASGHR